MLPTFPTNINLQEQLLAQSAKMTNPWTFVHTTQVSIFFFFKILLDDNFSVNITFFNKTKTWFIFYSILFNFYNIKELTSKFPTPVTVSSITKTSDASLRKIKKPSTKAYEDSTLQTALGKVRDSAMPLYTAAKKFGVPRTTLQYRLSEHYKNKGTRGPYTIFSANEEANIVKWLKDMGRKGYPITQNSLRFKISSFLKANPRPTPFTNNIPG